jgi:hypothetical protein
MNSMEVKGEEKRGKMSRLICLYDDWIDENSIGHDLISVGNLFKAYFSSFPCSKVDLEINRFEI